MLCVLALFIIDHGRWGHQNFGRVLQLSDHFWGPERHRHLGLSSMTRHALHYGSGTAAGQSRRDPRAPRALRGRHGGRGRGRRRAAGPGRPDAESWAAGEEGRLGRPARAGSPAGRTTGPGRWGRAVATPGLRAGAPALISPSSPPPARFPPPRTVPAAPALSLRPCPSRRPGRSSPARVPCCGRPDSEPRFLSRECASVFCVLLLCHEKEPLQNSAVRFFYQRSCRRRFV